MLHKATSVQLVTVIMVRKNSIDSELRKMMKSCDKYEISEEFESVPE